MPPEGEPLTVEQIQAIRKWIAEGAMAPSDEQPERDPREHWAYQKIVRPSIPNPKDHLGKKSIDAFLSRYHQATRSLRRSCCTKLELIRRVYVDLIGLPPSLEELQALESEWSDEDYERLVERLLNDPRHGERWARHWMDIWRL